jgi:hypothetical protein
MFVLWRTVNAAQAFGFFLSVKPKISSSTNFWTGGPAQPREELHPERGDSPLRQEMRFVSGNLNQQKKA